MTRSTIADRRQDSYDVLLELRSIDAAAISATTAGTGVDIGADKMEGFAVIIDVEAYTGYVASTAQWTITVESRDSADANPVTLFSAVPVGAAIRYRVPLEGSYIKALDSDTALIGVRATKTGSPGNLTYGAYATLQ